MRTRSPDHRLPHGMTRQEGTSPATAAAGGATRTRIRPWDPERLGLAPPAARPFPMTERSGDPAIPTTPSPSRRKCRLPAPADRRPAVVSVGPGLRDPAIT